MMELSELSSLFEWHNREILDLLLSPCDGDLIVLLILENRDVLVQHISNETELRVNLFLQVLCFLLLLLNLSFLFLALLNEVQALVFSLG